MVRYKKIVCENERGERREFDIKECIPFEIDIERCRTLEFSEGTNGELICIARRYSKDYVNPLIPKGYKHVCGEWNNGFVIKRSSDGSQFVWIPVGNLPSNGTLDGVSFNEKFGRRRYLYNGFDRFLSPESNDRECGYYEPFVGGVVSLFESVKKYGGFYISRYKISKNTTTGELQSVEGGIPCTASDEETVQKLAAQIESNDTITSYLTFGAAYDSVLEWLIQSNGEIHHTDKITWVPTIADGYINNLYDFGAHLEWTQELYGTYKADCVLRGDYTLIKDCYAQARYVHHYWDAEYGFRVVLCIK